MIYSCFLFYDEFPQLELTLNTLDSLVDYFVITEAPVMFSGLPKPLYFDEHKNDPQFKKFSHKIIHQILTDIPDDYVNLSPDSAKDELHRNVIEKTLAGNWWPHNHPPYGRDTFSKESLIRPLKNCNPNDIIILGDADELPNPVTLKNVLDNFDYNQVYNLEQKMYNYFLNCRKVACSEEIWHGNMILSFENFKHTAMCEMKMRRRGVFVDDGGWHFSYLGGKEGALVKMISGNETAMYTDHVKNSIQQNIDNCLTNGHDMYFRPCRYELTPIDESYPQYLRDNLDRFSVYIKK